MRGLGRSAQVAGWVFGCAAGLVACGDSTGQDGEFEPVAQGMVEGTVRGADGQPLGVVNVDLIIPADLDGQFSFDFTSTETGSAGDFSLPVNLLRLGKSSAWN